MSKYLMAHILVIFKQILKWLILMCKYCRMFNKFLYRTCMCIFETNRLKTKDWLNFSH